MTWKIFEIQSPELAEFARTRLHNKVAYLATTRKNGSPRANRVLKTITMLKQGKKEK